MQRLYPSLIRSKGTFVGAQRCLVNMQSSFPSISHQFNNGMSRNLSMLSIGNMNIHINRRQLSGLGNDGTHDDFKPKKAEVSDDLEEVKQMIDQQVKGHDVMLYMKGTPSQPQCGFSQTAVRVLNATGTSFNSVNVLEYSAIREGIKFYSEWPTIPQLFIKGEFVGGCDIMIEMYKDGSLEKLLKEHNLVEG